MPLTDTIIATSSPATGGGIRALVRLSGAHAWRLVRTLVELPDSLAPGYYGPLALPVLHPTSKLAGVLLFKGPRSFSGEDIAEVHVPNSPAVVRSCIDHLLREGQDNARLAGPGEFTARAFFNNKIDLTQAEGIAATINATTELELRAAASLRQGDLHKWIAAQADRIANILALIEAAIDFTEEEDIRFIEPSSLESTLDEIGLGITLRLHQSLRIDRLNALPRIVFVGKPNVGKSSLINALAGQDRSIVSPIAGTTRDVLMAVMHTGSGDIMLVDAPGEEGPADEVGEKMMAARGQAILEADLIVEVTTNADDFFSSHAESADYAARATGIQNKVDLLPPEKITTLGTFENGETYEARAAWQMVSATTGLHIPELRDALAAMTNRAALTGYSLALNQRQRVLLQAARVFLGQARSLVTQGATKHPELLAADLRRALDLLGQISGAISPDEILGRVFSKFCIGK